MEVIIDVQGFNHQDGKFVLKEIAGVSIGSGIIRGIFVTKPVQFSTTFKPPCEYSELSENDREFNRWCTKCHHGMLWNSGCLEYEMLEDFLHVVTRDVTVIYVKGLEKKKWLNKMLGGMKCIIEMAEELQCPSLHALKLLSLDRPVKCNNHDGYIV